MLRYSSRTHRKLMDESEYALQSATESTSPLISRVAGNVLGDNKIYRQWESKHASLLLPVARHKNSKSQVLALRNAEVQLVHQRALFDYLQTHQLRGESRARLFRAFHATRDYNDAVIAEHRQFMIALSSNVSADHIIDLMRDSNSKHLLEIYEKTYARYFEMNCYVAIARDSDCIDIVKSSMKDIRAQLMRSKRRIETVTPDCSDDSFDQEQLLARSGRYPALNYMVG